MSKRTEQIASTMKRVIAELLARKISDPRIRGLVSVTKIDVSPDLRDAAVYISVLPGHYGKTTIAGLRSSAGHIQSLVLKGMSIRAVPRLHFQLDESLKKESAVMSAIRRGVEREVDPIDPAAPGAPGAPGADNPTHAQPDPSVEERKT